LIGVGPRQLLELNPFSCSISGKNRCKSLISGPKSTSFGSFPILKSRFWPQNGRIRAIQAVFG